eukprot:4170597-Alexandrium_andersonii.AAC.1
MLTKPFSAERDVAFVDWSAPRLGPRVGARRFIAVLAGGGRARGDPRGKTTCATRVLRTDGPPPTSQSVGQSVNQSIGHSVGQ